MTPGERLWRLSGVVPLCRMSSDEIEALYDHLNATRFNGILPARRHQTEQVRFDVTRGGYIQEREDGATREMHGEWAPDPLKGFEGRRGWGVLRLYRGAYGDTLLHEMIHQALDTLDLPNGHGGHFQRVAAGVGYEIGEYERDSAAREAELDAIIG